MLSYEFPPLGGGGASVCYNLSKELVRSGHRVDIVTMGFKGLKRFETNGGIRIYRVPCLRKKAEICHTHEMLSYCIISIPLLVNLARKNGYTINHTHFIFPTGLISYLLKKITGLPYIITSHGSDVQGYNPDRFKIQHKLLRPLWKMIVKNSKAIVSPSESLKSLMLKNCEDKPIKVIPNAVDISSFKPKPKKKNILMVSRLLRRKGFQFVLEALGEIEGDFTATIVGDGFYADALKKLAHEKKINVRFLGWLDNKSAELRELYETSSIFVLPSEMENFSIALVEAMASGMAIITSDAGGCLEVVGDAALPVKPRDVRDIKEKLKLLIEDESLRKELGRRARRRVEENFTWQIVAHDYEELYRDDNSIDLVGKPFCYVLPS